MANVVVSLLAQLDEAYIARHLAREAGRRTAAKYVAFFAGLYVRLKLTGAMLVSSIES